MPTIAYIDKRFSAGSMAIINQANTIIDEYQAQGFDLTLRQVYYQFVSRDWLANRDTEYKRLGNIINDARLAGYIDWNAITDRTRYLRSYAGNDDPVDFLDGLERGFRRDPWEGQQRRVEVWIEKDALVGVLQAACEPLWTPYFSCRGYTSQSEMWGAAQRILRRQRDGIHTVVLHLGDHDPSGIDMSRDIEDRLGLFHAWPTFERIALNMDQVRQYDPPPNPAKMQDSRAPEYVREYGRESWELDALNPTTLVELIQARIRAEIEPGPWNAAIEREKREQEALGTVLTDAGLALQELLAED